MKIKSIFSFFKRVKVKKFIFLALRYFLFLLAGLCVAVFGLIVYYTWDLPQPEKFTETPFIQSTKIYDTTGKVLLYDIYGEEKREIVSFDKISDNLKQAILASEDERFYQHVGIDVRGIMRALWIDLTSQSRSQGGSTITQQLIRAVYLTKQKSVARKVREVVLSIELERKYSKDQIFDWYLNQVPFGENAYGAEAASQTYFAKPASDLSLAEAATLAALLPAPSYYSPYGSHKADLLQSKDGILYKMEKLGYITTQQLEDAKNEKLEFSKSKTTIKAPDFVLYVKKYLDEKYGDDYLKEKGLRVYTTLDWGIQEYVEQVIKDADETNKRKGANNTAMVVLDPRNGSILALVGSKDYFAEPYPKGCDETPVRSCLFDPKFDVATIGQRQPGSAFKPFAYATAFEKGYTPDTIVWDVKTEFNPNCNPSGDATTDLYGRPCYNPQDYDGRNRGAVSLRTALASSLNIPAVKTLYLAGIPETLQTAKNMGITTLTRTDDYGLSLVLGGGDVNLLEMVSAYGVFATEGNYIPPVSILKITDAVGNIIEENAMQPTKVLDTQVARQINSVLSDNNARAPLFGANSALYLPGYQVAAKTGTTQKYIDAWTVGYTPSVVVGVWAGNNNNTPTKDGGIGTAAPMWNKVIKKIVSSGTIESFTPPAPITNRNPILLGQVPAGSINTILYYIDKNNPLVLRSQDSIPSDPQYFMWQMGINSWLIKNGIPLSTEKPANEPPDDIITITPSSNETSP